MVLLLYFLIIVALPSALAIYVVFHGLERSRRCPCCAEETVALRSHTRRLISHFLRREVLQLRWCMTCGWSGSARIHRFARRAFADRPAGASASPQTGPAADRVDIRRLEVDGIAWQVMVQCWARDGLWVGRLLFVGTDGRECGEEGPSIEGHSAVEVLSRALSIPERTLAGRLRRAIH